MFWYYWKERDVSSEGEDFCLSDLQSIFPSVVESVGPLAMSLFWAADISDVVQVMLLLPVSQSEAGRERAALTEPVNQSHSLANKD